MSQMNQMNQMNDTVERNDSPKPAKRDKFSAMLQRFGRAAACMLLENWGYKLLALLIAVGMWAGLISQDPTLTREKIFSGVKVNVNGESTLKRNGFVVLGSLEETVPEVTLVVDVPQGQYARVQPSNYNVRIDLSKITSAGWQQVSIQSTDTASYGDVQRITPNKVSILVDEYVTRYRIPVAVTRTGEAPEGYWADEPTTDPPTVAITGPRSIVEKVATVLVSADQSRLPAQEGMSRRGVPFTLIDGDGQTVESSLLEVTTEGVLLDSVIVEQQVWSARSVVMGDLGLVQGTPAPGYEVKGVYINPATVIIAGRNSVISGLRLMNADGVVDVSDLSQTFTETLPVRQSSLVKYTSTDTVSVTVEIGPIVVDRSWEHIPVAVAHSPVGYEVEMNTSEVAFHVRGAQLWADRLSRAALKVTCDLSGITGPGEYEVPLQCHVDHADGQSYTCEVEPAMVTVIVTEPATGAE